MTTFAGGQEGAEPDDMGHGEKKCVMKTHKFVFLFRISFRCCADFVNILLEGAHVTIASSNALTHKQK